VRMIDPSKEIRYTYGDDLRGKKILMIVTGSVSAYKAPDLARYLVRHGAEVYILPSKEALKYITLDSLSWSVGGRVIDRFGYEAGHIYLVKDMDLIVVSPATANTIAKAAYGIADTDATLAIHSALGFGKKVLFIPVMHENMLHNPAYKEVVDRLRSYGAIFMEPFIEEEKAKFPPPRWIFIEILRALYPKPLKDMRVLVTAGPTREYIDPIRMITNRSSGKMGVYIAEQAYILGGNVRLIHGPITLEPYPRIWRRRVETTEEMYEEVMNNLKWADIYISAAAPVDYKPNKTEERKIDSRLNRYLDLELILTPKIVAEARRRRKDLFIISFKALYNVSREEMVEKAAEHSMRYGFNITVANDVGDPSSGFEIDTNIVAIVDSEGKLIKWISDSKWRIAREILYIASEKLSLH